MAKTLVAYFSWHGVTRKLAEEVAAKLDADLFEIKTVKEYPSNYLLCIGSAKLEHLKNEHPVLQKKVEHMEIYDKVLVGFPIWWYTCPNAILSFLEENALSGKTVLPFCTYGSSGKGSSEKDMLACAPDITLLPCIEATGLKEKAVEAIVAAAKA